MYKVPKIEIDKKIKFNLYVESSTETEALKKIKNLFNIRPKTLIKVKSNE